MKLGKMSQNLSSAAVVLGALRVYFELNQWHTPFHEPQKNETNICTFIIITYLHLTVYININ